MRKSSRLWWLHGAILVSAVIGCKNCGSSGTCGGPGGAPVATGSPYASPTAGGGPAMYSTGATPGYSGGSPMPSGGSFPTSTGSGYPMPGMSSGVGGMH
ncbi:MAG TPA: hypothetical protein VMG10_34300 [Gemmataceae bacterium]|nr:hypothetical protein [Gemmataceae bacterium]